MGEWPPWRLVIALALALLAVGCGGKSPKGGAPSATATPGAGGPPATLGAGALVPIGGGRSLFLRCEGSGRPTVLLEAGAGDADSHSWDGVLPELARATRTCAYDRAGAGQSVAPPGVRDARAQLADLDRLLAAARLPPPYVIVGHSYGGVLARAFARERPRDTAGLVLVDSIGRDGRRRQLAVWPPAESRAKRRGLASSVVGNVDLAAGEALADRLRSLGHTPLAVVTAGREAAFPTSPPRLARAMRRLWTTMQDELAALSRNSVHVVALQSDHDIPGLQPEVIVGAAQAMVAAARHHAPLPPCRRVFSGPGVRCV